MGYPRFFPLAVILALPLAGVMTILPLAASSPPTTERVSVNSVGTEGNADSDWPAISADGRYVAFHSDAGNLVDEDANGFADVFVHDRETRATFLVSIGSGGTQGNGSSGYPAISAEGRYVAFHSGASDLVAEDTNNYCDRDWDGEYDDNCSDVFVHDRQTGTTTRVSVDSAGNEADAASYGPAISADGRYVSFESDASNLVPGDTNGARDIFLHDRQTGATTRVSLDSAGNGGNDGSYWSDTSADGRYVAFGSYASNLVSGDTNGAKDVFVHDTQTGATTRVSVTSTGDQAEGSGWLSAISAHGRLVAFQSGASDLVPGDTNTHEDIFVHDRQTGATERVSVSTAGDQADSHCYSPAISADGRFVAFGSWATNLVAGDSNGKADIFVHDRHTGTTTRVSVTSWGSQANDYSGLPSITADGRLVAFDSMAWNLVPGDTDAAQDIFVRDRDDADGMPWGYELTHACLDPSTDDVSADPDLDDLTNLSEYGLSTDPCLNDTDSDGCADGEELVIDFEPTAFFDFYDVPAPAKPDPTPNGTKSSAVTMGDVMAVLFYVGTYNGDGAAPNPNGVAYDSVKGSCPVPSDPGAVQNEGLCYDRSPSPPPDPPWQAGPPDGAISMGDVVVVLAQVGLDCTAQP